MPPDHHRLRPQLAQVAGATLFMQRRRTSISAAAQPARISQIHATDSTSTSSTSGTRLLAKLQKLPALRDVASDNKHQRHGRLTIDRDQAARFGIQPAPSIRRSTTHLAAPSRAVLHPGQQLHVVSRSRHRARAIRRRSRSCTSNPADRPDGALSAMTRYDTQHVTYLSSTIKGSSRP